jgi:hypothetical protein
MAAAVLVPTQLVLETDETVALVVEVDLEEVAH